MTKKSEKEEGSQKEKYIAVQDCMVNHGMVVFIFRKGDEVKNKEIIEILKAQGLVQKT